MQRKSGGSSMHGVRVGSAGVVLARTVGSAAADGTGTDTDGGGTSGVGVGMGAGVNTTPLGVGCAWRDRRGVAGGSEALARLEGVGAGGRGVMDTNATVEAVTTRPLARTATMRTTSP